MKIKVFVIIIENLNAALFLSLILCVIAVAFHAKDGELLVFEALIIFPFMIAFVFRLSLINLYLKKCRYPVPFLSVLQKLGLLTETDINWSDEAKADLYKPTYSTEKFLANNALKSNFSNKYGSHFSPVLQFNTTHLGIDTVQLRWPDILDWHYFPGDEYTSDKINIFHFDKEVSFETNIDLDTFTANKIDVLLLLSHYKAKYG